MANGTWPTSSNTASRTKRAIAFLPSRSERAEHNAQGHPLNREMRRAGTRASVGPAYLRRGANDWFGNGDVAGRWTTMKPRFAASWHALQAAVSLSNATVNLARSRALMALSTSPIGGIVMDSIILPTGVPL